MLKDGLTLFEFSLRMGALITYVMMTGMKYQGDENVWSWIQKAITLQSLLNAFTRIEPVASRLNSNINNNIKETEEYEMDPDYLRSLEKAYENVFPEVYRRLENITEFLPHQIESREKWLKGLSRTRVDPNNSRRKEKHMNFFRKGLTI